MVEAGGGVTGRQYSREQAEHGRNLESLRLASRHVEHSLYDVPDERFRRQRTRKLPPTKSTSQHHTSKPKAVTTMASTTTPDTTTATANERCDHLTPTIIPTNVVTRMDRRLMKDPQTSEQVRVSSRLVPTFFRMYPAVSVDVDADASSTPKTTHNVTLKISCPATHSAQSQNSFEPIYPPMVYSPVRAQVSTAC
jgi:hypothetical protein